MTYDSAQILGQLRAKLLRRVDDSFLADRADRLIRSETPECLPIGKHGGKLGQPRNTLLIKETLAFRDMSQSDAEQTALVQSVVSRLDRRRKSVRKAGSKYRSNNLESERARGRQSEAVRRATVSPEEHSRKLESMKGWREKNADRVAAYRQTKKDSTSDQPSPGSTGAEGIQATVTNSSTQPKIQEI